jgi:hypothetical protein
MRKLIPLTLLTGCTLVGSPAVVNPSPFTAPTPALTEQYIGPNYKTNAVKLNVPKDLAKSIGLANNFSLVSTKTGATNNISMTTNTFRSYLALSYVEGCVDNATQDPNTSTPKRDWCISRARLFFSGDSNATRTLNILSNRH